MIPKAMHRRLARLEAAFRADQPPALSKFWKASWRFWDALLAYHVGRWQPQEDVFEAWLRALGYETRRGFANDVCGDYATVEEHPLRPRYHSAMDTMFALEKIDGKTAHPDVALEAIGRLIDSAEKGGMPLGEKPPYLLASLSMLTDWPLI